MHRRKFLRTAVSAAAAALTGVHLHASPVFSLAATSTSQTLQFPANFLFGAASSCVQIEGSAFAGGKGLSIWDTFAAIPGKIADGTTPNQAGDSYIRWREDVALLREMGIKSYRFSIAWPRILPQGKGAVNQKGLDHYNRILDALLAANISPLITAYHWDLPQALQDAGGWPNRDIASHFADYAGILAQHYGDRVERWCLVNEPQAFTVVGYGWGTHAPGLHDRNLMLRATHTVNLAQAMGFRAMKVHHPRLQLGTAYDYDLCHPATDSEADHLATQRYDAFRNRWFIDPVFTGKYPEAFADGVPYEAMGFKPGDESILKVPLDYSGVNYYCGLEHVSVGEKQALLHGLDAHTVKPTSFTYPQGVREVMMHFAREYKRPIIITETGFESDDTLDTHGCVHDPGRIRYLREMIASLHSAIQGGADVRSMHVWCLLDDWEWTEGLRPRMGLVYIDYKNGRARTIKDSGTWYGKIARSREMQAN